jgi:trans-aconitate methyltransferase
MLEERQQHITSCYDAAAQKYAENFFDELDHKPMDRLLLSYFHEETKGRGTVCDMGCGPGEVADYLYQRGAEVIGIDLSKAMIAEAKRLSPRIEFKVDDMFNLDIPDDYLAGIAAFYAIVNFELEGDDSVIMWNTE